MNEPRSGVPLSPHHLCVCEEDQATLSLSDPFLCGLWDVGYVEVVGMDLSLISFICAQVNE